LHVAVAQGGHSAAETVTMAEMEDSEEEAACTLPGGEASLDHHPLHGKKT